MTVEPTRQPLKKFLVCYGDQNEFWLCDAESREHAVEQFDNAGIAGSINEVFECVPAVNRYFVRQRRAMWVSFVQEIEAEDRHTAVDRFYDRFDPQYSFVEAPLRHADPGPATAFDQRDYPTPQAVVEAD